MFKRQKAAGPGPAIWNGDYEPEPQPSPVSAPSKPYAKPVPKVAEPCVDEAETKDPKLCIGCARNGKCPIQDLYL